ncbi:MAG: FAD-binding oxidoreductase [Limibaculum sp.]
MSTSSSEPAAGGSRVIVIGAGIVGTCCALELRKKGFEVTLVDPVPPGESCSFGNAGVLASWSCVPMSLPGTPFKVPGWLFDPEGPLAIRPAYLPRLAPWLLRFVRAGRAARIPAAADALIAINGPTVGLYKELTKEAGAPELIRDCAHIQVSRDPGYFDLDDLEWRLRRERGATLTPLAGGEIREIEPEIAPAYTSGVMIAPQGYTTNPARLVKVLAEYFQRLGGEIRQAEVLGLRPQPSGPVRLETTVGELTADWLVVAAGAWSAKLAARIGVKIPLEAERGYHVTFAEPGIELRHMVTEAKRMFIATSMEPGLRVAGTAEFAGLDAAPNWRRARVLAGLAKRLFPGLDTARPSEWMGQRPALPDSLPVIGPAPGAPDVVFAFGHGHTGLTAAPMTARIVAGMVAGEPLNLDVSPYRVARF